MHRILFSSQSNLIVSFAKFNIMKMSMLFVLIMQTIPALSHQIPSSSDDQIFILDNGVMDKRFEQPSGLHFGFGKRSTNQDFMDRGVRLGFGKRSDDEDYMNRGFPMGFGKRNEDLLNGKGMRLGFGKRGDDDFMAKGLRMGFGKRSDDDFMTKGMRLGFGKRGGGYIATEVTPLFLKRADNGLAKSLESMEFSNPSWQHLQRFNLGLGRR